MKTPLVPLLTALLLPSAALALDADTQRLEREVLCQTMPYRAECAGRPTSSTPAPTRRPPQAAPAAAPSPTSSAVTRWYMRSHEGECGVTEDGPLAQIRLAEMYEDPYRMEDVVQDGKVVETTMIRSTRSARRMNPQTDYPPTWQFTWYATFERCQQAVQRLRDAAQDLVRRYR
jgi:hypothetical protein